MPRIFISHRRSDTGDLIPKLVDILKAAFGETNIIVDNYVLRGGTSFRHRLVQDIVSSDAFVILVGKNWLSRQPNGVPWVYREESWTRFEIKVAMIFRKTIVPIMLEGSTVIASDVNAVPDEIRQIMLSQYTVVSQQLIENDVQRIRQHLSYLAVDRKEAYPSNSVFISYRRASSKSFALELRGYLQDAKIRSFIDLEDMPSGKWRENLRREIIQNNYFLLVLDQRN